MNKFTLSVKAANDLLETMGAKASLVIAADKEATSISAPANNRTTAVLIAALLEKSPKEVSEMVKKYLEGDNDEL